MRTAAVDTSLFRCGHLERIPLGTSYVGVVQHVARLLHRLPTGTELAIDFTGVGRPVADMFGAAGLSPTLVLITGGSSETYDGGIVAVPKLSLISRLQALLHEGRLKIHRDLAEAPTLVRELQDFRVEFTAGGAITFSARVGKHDDLVLALAIAAWRAFGGGPSDGIFRLYEQQSAALRGEAEPVRTVVGVDLGQSRDPTAIAIVQRVPASRLEERLDRPRHEPPIIQPEGEALYARGSVERAEQDARRQAAPKAGAGWLPEK
jgi:hypothetical protein